MHIFDDDCNVKIKDKIAGDGQQKRLSFLGLYSFFLNKCEPPHKFRNINF